MNGRLSPKLTQPRKYTSCARRCLMEVGDAYGTVDWHQGIEFYNFARRPGRKDFILLVYPGEAHGLGKKENQVDYHRRINERFGHYLKDEPAPKCGGRTGDVVGQEGAPRRE